MLIQAVDSMGFQNLRFRCYTLMEANSPNMQEETAYVCMFVCASNWFLYQIRNKLIIFFRLPSLWAAE